MSNIDPRIGQLNNGKFYAHIDGYAAEPFVGTYDEVAAILSGKVLETAPKARVKRQQYSVLIRFQYPAWDEVDGIEYTTEATSKADAIATVRRLASDDGHIGPGRGRYWLTATKYTPA